MSVGIPIPKSLPGGGYVWSRSYLVVIPGVGSGLTRGGGMEWPSKRALGILLKCFLVILLKKPLFSYQKV